MSLVQSLRLLPNQSIAASVRIDPMPGRESESPLLVEHSAEVEESTGVVVVDAL